MPDEHRILELVQEVLDTDRTPEDVCADCPELLWDVRRQWKRVCRVDAQLAAMFPASDTAPTRACLQRDLPQIPGYEIEAILGRGGMGVVFKATHLKLNRPVALKMMIYGGCATSLELSRFQREAEAAAGLQHPHIVQVHDVGEHDGRPYFTMELVEGGSLAENLRGIPQPALSAAELVSKLALAVHAAHLAGIVHRDLKPSNVLLSADGTPKISDFGLARRLEGATRYTLSGIPVGTPSYMAPEQAQGQSREMGPAVDIYALGAILYEMLTGRPPFRAESAAATVQQVITQEPATPTRLNAKVPRDLETICLKCLNKEPPRRYATAEALADDPQRFQRGEPIKARRLGSLERMSKWVGRRPAVAALIAISVLFTALLIGTALWNSVERAQRRQAIALDLREISQLQEQARWADATVAIERAAARLQSGGDGDLRQTLDQARSDLDLVVELDRIRLNRETSGGELSYYKTIADRQYGQAFEKSGLATVQDPPDVVAARVKASAVRVALVAALDDWAVCAADKNRRDWLLEIAREADGDSLGWSDRIRAAATWDDAAALSHLAETLPVKGQSISLLLALGERLGAAGGDATGFLKRVQKDNPADFWANMVLGNALFNAAPFEAAAYYRAALASRPEAPVAYTALGDALRIQKRLDEADSYYRQALSIDPNYARGHTNLGNFLRDTGKIHEAISSYRTALAIEPNYAWAHLGLANTLSDAGRVDEALEHYQQFQATGPANPHVANILRSYLVRRGRGEEARLEWKRTLELDPPDHDAWFGYAEMCLFLGHEDEYRRARRDLVRRFGDTSDPFVAEKTARAILLAPPSEEELKTAIALAECAVAAKSTTPEWIYAYFLFAQGLAEYRQDDFNTAISIMNADAGTVLGPCPRLVAAMAKFRLGAEEEARALLAAECRAVDWSLEQVRSHDQWLWHVLRREAETLIGAASAK